jgi:hypothetical protein
MSNEVSKDLPKDLPKEVTPSRSLVMNLRQQLIIFLQKKLFLIPVMEK